MGYLYALWYIDIREEIMIIWTCFESFVNFFKVKKIRYNLILLYIPTYYTVLINNNIIIFISYIITVFYYITAYINLYKYKLYMLHLSLKKKYI